MPGDAFYEALDYFLVGEPITVPNSFTYGGESEPQILLAIETGVPNIGHAVILWHAENGDILVQDPQDTKHPFKLLPRSIIIFAYEATNPR